MKINPQEVFKPHIILTSKLVYNTHIVGKYKNIKQLRKKDFEHKNMDNSNTLKVCKNQKDKSNIHVQTMKKKQDWLCKWCSCGLHSISTFKGNTVWLGCIQNDLQKKYHCISL